MFLMHVSSKLIHFCTNTLISRNDLAVLFRSHRMHSVHAMRPVATDGVAWSVCLSVGHVREPVQKPAEPIEMPFGWVTRVGAENHA